MKIKFIAGIKKGNAKGTGFFYISKEGLTLLSPSVRVSVKLLNNLHFFAKVIKHDNRLGIYVPKHLMEKNNLLDKNVKIQINEIDGFYSKMYSDGRIYLPQDIVKKQKIEQNEIILIRGIENNKVVREKYSKIQITDRKKRHQIEYTCVFDKKFYGKNLIFKIKNETPKNWKPKFNINVIDTLLEKMHYGFINRNLSIAFYGSKIPVIVSNKFKYSDIAFYLGAYFSDGTKIGNNWAICASTFEQAKYYWKMHNLLIKDSKPEFTISYTNIYNTDNAQLKRNLVKMWENEVGIKVNKFRIRKPTGKSISKWNKYGTLVIRESRQILLDFYNGLLKSLIEEILSKKNKRLAFDFICGVMEGDGSTPSKTHGHILIHTNKEEAHILKSISRAADIKFKLGKNGENKYFLRIGSLEILRNFHLLKDKIFELYPKRRKNFFERFKKVGAVKFLGGNHQSTNWVKAWLRNNGFADRNYKITEKGLRVSYYIQNYITTR